MSSFANPELVRVVRDFCVPVTWNKIRRGRYEDDEKFWEKLHSQGMGNHVVSYCFCTVEGKLLGLYSRDEGGIKKAFAKWRNLPDSERKPGALAVPEHGRILDAPGKRFGLPPEGLALRVYFRALQRDPNGELRAPEKISLGISKTVVRAEANGDFLWLAPEEWRALVPPHPRPGDSLPVSPPICQRIARFHLVDGACCLAHFWKPEEIRNCAMKLTVERVNASAIDLRLSGTARVGPKAPGTEFRLDGFLHYDVRKKSFTRFDMVALGDDFHRDIASGKPMPLGIAFELLPPHSPERQLPPYRIWYDDQGAKDYFGR